jgi:hypothetical protein
MILTCSELHSDVGAPTVGALGKVRLPAMAAYQLAEPVNIMLEEH